MELINHKAGCPNYAAADTAAQLQGSAQMGTIAVGFGASRTAVTQGLIGGQQGRQHPMQMVTAIASHPKQL